MSWNIFAYATNQNEKSVKGFIQSLSASSIAKVTHKMNLLNEYGPYLKMPHSKKIKNNLFELRIRGEQEIRIFYAFDKSNIYLLHGFKKQSQQTPAKEIKLALARLKDLT